jgi:RNA polymerase sigma-70 factor, ECF subfamily
MDVHQALAERAPRAEAVQEREFEAFVLASRDKALRLAYSYLGDWEEARDAVQEAFLRVHRRAGQFRGDAELGTWFYRILSNHCKDCLRRRKVRSWLPFWRGAAEGTDERSAVEATPDPRPDPSRLAEERAFRRALEQAIRALPRRQREVFRLKALGGLSLSQVASTLGLSAGSVKTHFFRAGKSLQEALAPWKDGS